jgi:hypothetical protein
VQNIGKSEVRLLIVRINERRLEMVKAYSVELRFSDATGRMGKNMTDRCSEEQKRALIELINNENSKPYDIDFHSPYFYPHHCLSLHFHINAENRILALKEATKLSKHYEILLSKRQLSVHSIEFDKP